MKIRSQLPEAARSLLPRGQVLLLNEGGSSEELFLVSIIDGFEEKEYIPRPCTLHVMSAFLVIRGEESLLLLTGERLHDSPSWETEASCWVL